MTPVYGIFSSEAIAENDRRRAARCRINKDTEGKSEEVTEEAHCLKTRDTVVHGQNHEPNDTRRIP